ncbi:pyridoxamine 5'-phosphate oxidase family protein [Candidatus Enterococcus murrayae]|uniref:Pyridoxamine 5'-phosphate oxidase family protein n=1 Tax=Candidatus Enterococcus murrayae TaxID=2815321 RepID=A0ABS3HCZ4_9ENTE|nr:pyridoxamine 5'-phosphate oxidase family protein [Enterococcus sp. MJM16]MBO0451316.1 pyridoxamine 5'-phosphate oxidase family protein [Enterococcus sp. MJM16]
MTNMNQAFHTMMEEQLEIALATSVANQPNVRIVNFLYDEKANCLYFSTFKGNDKVKEFSQNPQVAFTTVPKGQETGHVRAQGTVAKSAKSLYDLAEPWVKKIPSFQQNIDQAGAMLDVYEITFDQAQVILDMENQTVIEL